MITWLSGPPMMWVLEIEVRDGNRYYRMFRTEEEAKERGLYIAERDKTIRPCNIYHVKFSDYVEQNIENIVNSFKSKI